MRTMRWFAHTITIGVMLFVLSIITPGCTEAQQTYWINHMSDVNYDEMKNDDLRRDVEKAVKKANKE